MIHWYGLLIDVGIFAFIWFFIRHPRRAHLMTVDQFLSAVGLGIIAGIMGGRIMYLLTTPEEFSSWMSLFYFTQGLSSAGAIMFPILLIPLYLRWHQIPILPTLDIAAIYAPLIQAFGRIGCFIAGCCYGAPTTVTWAVTYTHSESIAPCFTPLHPAQLYSSGTLFLMALLFHTIVQHRVSKSGQLLALYITGAGIERFIIDFFRDDRTFFHTYSALSISQWIALSMVIIGIVCFGVASWANKPSPLHHHKTS